MVCLEVPIILEGCREVHDITRKEKTGVSAATGGDGLSIGVCTPVEEHFAMRTGSFGITDNDSHGIDPITGHDMVSNITAERADKTWDIVILYD